MYCVLSNTFFSGLAASYFDKDLEDNETETTDTVLDEMALEEKSPLESNDADTSATTLSLADSSIEGWKTGQDQSDSTVCSKLIMDKAKDLSTIDMAPSECVTFDMSVNKSNSSNINLDQADKAKDSNEFEWFELSDLSNSDSFMTISDFSSCSREDRYRNHTI